MKHKEPTYHQIASCCEKIFAEGSLPNIENLSDIFSEASPATIANYLQQWKSQRILLPMEANQYEAGQRNTILAELWPYDGTD